MFLLLALALLSTISYADEDRVQLQEETARGKCGIFYFIHIAKCGGSPLSIWLRKSLHTKRKTDFVYGRKVEENESVNATDPNVYHSWVKQVAEIDRMTEGWSPSRGWAIIHQHSFTPGLIHSMDNITRWRNTMQKNGCKFILFTLLRNPVDRAMSHMQHSQVEHAGVENYLLGQGQNYLLRHLLYGDCDYLYDTPRCSGKNLKHPGFSEIKGALKLMNEFDLIGTVDNLEPVRYSFKRLTGMESRPAPKSPTNEPQKYELNEHETDLFNKFGVGYDQLFYDAIIHPNDIVDAKQEDIFPDLSCYAKNYPYLKETFCGKGDCNYQGLYNHWIETGNKKGLNFGCLDISTEDLVCYAKRYEGIFKGFCDNDVKTCKIGEMYSHWTKIGSKSDMVVGCAPKKKHLQCYADRYPDLKKVFCAGSECQWDELYQHHVRFGKQKHLLFGCIENKRELLCSAKRYPDLLHSYCQDDEEKCDYKLLALFWEYEAKADLRFGCVDIPAEIKSADKNNLACYVTRYPDLHDAWCTDGECNWEDVYVHWLEVGEKNHLLLDCIESRADLNCYADRYPDLKEAFCSQDECDYDSLLLHWKFTGGKSGYIYGCISIDSELAGHLTCYAKRYPDLFKGFCKGKEDGCQLLDLYQHWNVTGSTMANSVFGCVELTNKLKNDAICYGARYFSLFKEFCESDETKCNPEQLYIHYKQHGAQQNLRFGCFKDLKNEAYTSLVDKKNHEHEGVELITLATGMSSKMEAFLASILPKVEQDKNLNLRILGFGQEWRGWQWRAQMYFEAIKNSKAKYLAIIDTDVFVNTHFNSKLLIDKYWEATGGAEKVLVSAEPLCCTMDMSLDSEQDMLLEMKKREAELTVTFKQNEGVEKIGDHKHVFPNFGLIIGTKESLLKLIVELLAVMDDFSDDQTVMQQFYTEFPDKFILDHSQALFGTTDGRNPIQAKKCVMYDCEEDSNGVKHLYRKEQPSDPKSYPLFFHGPGDDLDCMNKLKQCVDHSFAEQKLVEQKFSAHVDCAVDIEYKRPSWMSSKHRSLKISPSASFYDQYKCLPAASQKFELELSKYKFVTVEGTGRCQTGVNSYLAFGTVTGRNDLMECVKDCAKSESCSGFTYDRSGRRCEFQCAEQSEMCPFAAFPQGNEGKKCLILANDQSEGLKCYAKDYSFCEEHAKALKKARYVDRRRSLAHQDEFFLTHRRRILSVVGAPTAAVTQAPTPSIVDFNNFAHCVSWGDPHFIGFTQNFNNYEDGDFILFGYSGLQVHQVQASYKTRPRRAFNQAMYITINGQKVFEITSPTAENTLLDGDLITEKHVADVSTHYWPSNVTPPGRFHYMLTPTGISGLNIFVRKSKWRSYEYIDIGIQFNKMEISQTSGLCMNPTEDFDPPAALTCEALTTCCSRFQPISTAAYNGCLVDAAHECCEDSGDEQCCAMITEGSCDVDFSCSLGDCCDKVSGMCTKCPVTPSPVTMIPTTSLPTVTPVKRVISFDQVISGSSSCSVLERAFQQAMLEYFASKGFSVKIKFVKDCNSSGRRLLDTMGVTVEVELSEQDGGPSIEEAMKEILSTDFQEIIKLAMKENLSTDYSLTVLAPAHIKEKLLEHIGCFLDHMYDRAFTYRHPAKRLSIKDCAAECRKKGAIFMGYQWQKECWCGGIKDDVRKHGKTDACKDGKGGYRGEISSIAAYDLYEISRGQVHAENKEKWCPQYGTSPGETLKKYWNVKTRTDCQEICETKISCQAIIYRKQIAQCFLLKRRFNPNFIPSEDGDKLVVVANRGETKFCHKMEHAGCFYDKPAPKPDRVMSLQHSKKGLSLYDCSSYCRRHGYYYMGYQWQIQCWCGRQTDDVRRHGVSLDCKNQKGGSGKSAAFDLYIVGHKEKSGPMFTEVGCYKDQLSKRALKNKMTGSDVSLEQCAKHCKASSFDYFGYESQKECWCGHGSQLDLHKRYGVSFYCEENGKGSKGSDMELAFNLYRINY